MTGVQELANFLNRVKLRSADGIIVDDTAAYIAEFEELTGTQYLINAVPDEYTLPDFEKRGTVTHTETGLHLHRNREVEPVTQPVEEILTDTYNLPQLNPRPVSIPVDAWNTIEATIPSPEYCQNTDYHRFTDLIPYHEADEINVRNNHEEFLPDSYDQLTPQEPR